MAKNRRGKKSRKNKKPEIDPNKCNIENLRNSVSGDIFNNSTVNSLHLVDLLNPIATPSPKSETDRTSVDETSDETDNTVFKTCKPPRRFKPINPTLKIHSPNNIYETPRPSLRKLKFDVNESSSGEEYQTPLKRIRSIVRIENPVSPTGYKKTNLDFGKRHKNYDQVFVTPRLYTKQNDNIIAGTLHYSTPKDVLYNKIKSDSNLIKLENNFSKHSFASLHSLSPIMKHDIEERLSKVCLTPLPPALLTPTKKVFNKIRRYGRFNVRLPVSFISLCSWLGITIKKALASIKRLCYESMQQSITVAETSAVASGRSESPQCKHCNCHSKIQSLNSKMKNLASELSCIQNQLQVIVTENIELKAEIDELKQRKPCIAAPPPPPPPPLPPPPQPLPLITPIGRPLKNSIRQCEKQTNENSRPLITVDDILGVRLRKINGCNPSKKPIQQELQVTEGIFKQVKLRPPRNRSQSPSVLISPRTSLARILKNVDTNVRRVRRYKLTTSINYDDSRQRYSVICNPTNETAPDIRNA